MAGQLSHFVSYVDEDVPYAHNRYENEYDRLLAVMDVRLQGREFLANNYSIADIACFPWVLPYDRLGNDLDKFPYLRRWFDEMKQRPAVRKGVDLGSEWPTGLASDEAKAIPGTLNVFVDLGRTGSKQILALEDEILKDSRVTSIKEKEPQENWFDVLKSATSGDSSINNVLE